jgi:ubiquinone/menaquinone biosynthesis C-methylase UbiE
VSSYTDQSYLRKQYSDESNLRARIDLHKRFSTNTEPWHRWVFDQLDLPAAASVLEVGCGPAELWRQNLDRIPEGWRITLTDNSPGMVDAAREAMGDRAEYAVADVHELTFSDEFFDAVIANHMLYHVADRPRAYHEFARVLRTGGRLYAATNGRGHLEELRALTPGRDLWSVDFRLDNGPKELARVLDDVQVVVFPDALEVTEAEPVVAYLRSFTDDLAGVEETVRATIQREGAFHVTKSTGLLTARKP